MEQEFNPYAAPAAEGGATPGRVAPSVELFTPSQVAAASLLASAGAGVALIAVNERRLGRGSRGLWALVPALATFSLVFVETLPSLLIAGLSSIAMLFTARTLFGADVEEHLSRGGRRAPGGSAVGWALLGALGMVVVVFGLAFAAALVFGVR